MITEETINCENPQVIFDRSVIRKIVENGNYYIDGKRYNLLDAFDFANHFDFDKFNPYKLGLISIKTITDKKTRSIIEQKFCINYERFNNCFTISKSGSVDLLFICVPCGHCIFCRHSKANNLVTRLEMESELHDCKPLFVTLTYSDFYLPLNGVRKSHLTAFIKRLRERLKDDKIRYCIVSEYGKNDEYLDSRGRLRRGTARPHYHMILFGINYIQNSPVSLSLVVNAIEKAWSSDGRKKKSYQYGRVDVKPCDKGAFRYVAKYIVKTNKVPKGCKPNFKLVSRRPGLGAGFIEKFGLRQFFVNHTHSEFLHKFYDGQVRSIIPPKYIVNKIFPTFSMSVPLELRRAFELVPFHLKKLASAGYYVRPLYEYFCSFIPIYKKLGYRLPVINRKDVNFYTLKNIVWRGNDEYGVPLLEPKQMNVVAINEIIHESIGALRELSNILEKYKTINIEKIFDDIRLRNLLYSSIRLRLCSSSLSKNDKIYNLNRLYNKHLSTLQI